MSDSVFVDEQNGIAYGCFFLSYRNGRAVNQGRIDRNNGDGTWSVFLYDWLLGQENGPHQYRPEEFDRIEFFPTDKDMRLHSGEGVDYRI